MKKFLQIVFTLTLLLWVFPVASAKSGTYVAPTISQPDKTSSTENEQTFLSRPFQFNDAIGIENSVSVNAPFSTNLSHSRTNVLSLSTDVAEIKLWIKNIRYKYYSQQAHILFQSVDIIFPFHYFW